MSLNIFTHWECYYPSLPKFGTLSSTVSVSVRHIGWLSVLGVVLVSKKTVKHFWKSQIHKLKIISHINFFFFFFDETNYISSIQ